MKLREPVVYAVLLLCALGFAYQTWTRDTSDGESGGAPLWEESPEDIVGVSYETEEVSVVIERRGSADDTYLWATAIETSNPAPPTGVDAGADSAAADADASAEPAAADARADSSAAATAAADTAARAAPVATSAPAADTTRFIVGARGERLIEDLAVPRTMRELGLIDEAARNDYGLADATARVSVDFGAAARDLVIGGEVYGSGDRYALDPATGRVYVLSQDLIEPLVNAAARLLERRLHAFDRDEVVRVVVRAGDGQERTRQRTAGPDFGDETWTAPGSPDRPDQTFANFMERLRRLWVDEYRPDEDVSGLERVVRLEYFGENDEPIGFFELFRQTGAQGEPAYLLRTELTRVPARTYEGLAEQVAADAAQLF